MARDRTFAARAPAGAGFLRRLVACVLLCSAGTALAQKPPLTIPGDADVVVERLPRGYAAASPAAAVSPRDEAARLLALSARTGDLRLSTRAEALLQGLPANSPDPVVLQLRAHAAQHRHDFAAARRWLERAIAIDQRDAGARLTLAQIHLVQGDLRRARAGCAALALGLDAQAGWLCAAALALRNGEHAKATAAMERWLARPSLDAETLRYARVLRADIAAQGGDRAADAWYERALAAAPADVRTRAAFARHLAATGRHARALAVIGPAPETDGLALLQALSARALGRADAGALRASLDRRYARLHALGATPELRDEAEFRLSLAGDSDAALALAQRNFATQKDREDVDLLRRAAAAAGRPQALAAVHAWARREGVAMMEAAR